MQVRLTMALAAMLLLGGLTLAPSVEASTRHFSPEVRAARAYALERIGPAQFKCLDTLFERESHWNPKAHNARTGAHGIPQAVPGSKMGKGWKDDPLVQVRWGIRYVNGRYRGACNALAHAYATGWY